MGGLERDGQALSACRQYRTLMAVSQAIVSHRDFATLFHELAGRLHLVVRFDYLACVLYDAASNMMSLHVLETTEPIPAQAPQRFSKGEMGGLLPGQKLPGETADEAVPDIQNLLQPLIDQYPVTPIDEI